MEALLALALLGFFIILLLCINSNINYGNRLAKRQIEFLSAIEQRLSESNTRAAKLESVLSQRYSGVNFIPPIEEEPPLIT